MCREAIQMSISKEDVTKLLAFSNGQLHAARDIVESRYYEGYVQALEDVLLLARSE